MGKRKGGFNPSKVHERARKEGRGGEDARGEGALDVGAPFKRYGAARSGLRQVEDSDDSGDEGGLFGKDDVDKFHGQKDKLLFKDSALHGVDSDDDPSEEEMMPFSDDEDEDESDFDEQADDDDDEPIDNIHAVKVKKDDMASDLEDEDEEGYLPDPKAWGKKKQLYYSTDFVDKDFRKSRFEEQDEAKAEEEEALAIQKRLLQEMNAIDFDLDMFVSKEDYKDVKADEEAEDGDEGHKVEVDLSSLSKKERLNFLKKDSPELIPLLEDFKVLMTEAKNKLKPILDLGSGERLLTALTQSSGFSLIQTKYHLILRYATNICFYLVLKSKRIPVKNHPVIKQLFGYKKLITELDRLQKESKVDKEMEYIIDMLKREEEPHFESDEKSSDKTSLKRTKASKKSKTLDAKKVKFTHKETDRRQEGRESADDALIDSEEDVDKGPDVVDQPLHWEEDEQDTRRGITYQIQKNKGLTAQKRKELRNPRVKHRMKYKKAQVRRKGQVREPRKEVTKYGGELTGIKASLVRSIKFK